MFYGPLAPTIQVTLDKPRTLVFDMNTFSAFEEATKGKSGTYFDTLSKLFSLFKDIPDAPEARQSIDPLKFLSKISISEVQGLVWAALHEYPNGGDDPYWPLTMNQVGRLITMNNVVEVTLAALSGALKTQPTKEELKDAGESQGAAELQLDQVIVMPPTGEAGGSVFGR